MRKLKYLRPDGIQLLAAVINHHARPKFPDAMVQFVLPDPETAAALLPV